MTQLKQILYSLSNIANQEVPYTVNLLRIEALARKTWRTERDLNKVTDLLLQDPLLQEIEKQYGEENALELAFYLIQKAIAKEPPAKNELSSLNLNLQISPIAS